MIALRTKDYRCDDGRYWLSAHNFQVPTPTSQIVELEQQIRFFLEQSNSSIAWKIEIHNSSSADLLTKKGEF
jgi:hypothetical protein